MQQRHDQPRRSRSTGPAPLRLLAFPILALFVLVGSVAADVVRLKDGTLVHGEIVEFEEANGFLLERADNGGRVRFRWEHLSPEEVVRIKADRGFTGEDPEPWLVEVVHLVMKNGTTESGVLVSGERRDVYTLRRRSGEESFPRHYVQRVETGHAEGLTVYQPEELYPLILTALGTPVDVAGHFAVAVACEGAALYGTARDHYDAVLELDAAFKTELIGQRLDRLAIKIEDAEETTRLEQIRNRLYRKKFVVALEMLEQFRADYPLSRQLGEAMALEQEVFVQRREHFAGRIVSDYFSFLGKAVSQVARDDRVTIDVAVELLEESLHEDVINRIAGVYELEPEALEEMWAERRPGSLRTKNYGTGSFILGEDKALDWSVGKDEDVVEEEELLVEEDDDLATRIKKVQQQRQQERNQRRNSSRRDNLTDIGPTPDEWWSQSPRDEREAWLLAYYAEFVEQLLVVRARPRACRLCDAEGLIQTLNEDGEYEFVTCPSCKGLKVERLLSFR